MILNVLEKIIKQKYQWLTYRTLLRFQSLFGVSKNYRVLIEINYNLYKSLCKENLHQWSIFRLLFRCNYVGKIGGMLNYSIPSYPPDLIPLFPIGSTGASLDEMYCP